MSNEKTYTNLHILELFFADVRDAQSPSEFELQGGRGAAAASCRLASRASGGFGGKYIQHHIF